MTNFRVQNHMNKKVPKEFESIDLEQYESVIRQQKKVLTRMDEVLDNCTNITPEETSDWKDFWKNMLESSSKKSSSKVG